MVYKRGGGARSSLEVVYKRGGGGGARSSLEVVYKRGGGGARNSLEVVYKRGLGVVIEMRLLLLSLSLCQHVGAKREDQSDIAFT